MKQIGTGLPLGLHRGEHTGALWGFTHLQGLRSDTTTFGKTDGGRTWDAVLESLSNRRAFSFFNQIRLTIHQFRNADDEPSRRSEDLHIPMVQALILQIAAHQ